MGVLPSEAFMEQVAFELDIRGCIGVWQGEKRGENPRESELWPREAGFLGGLCLWMGQVSSWVWLEPGGCGARTGHALARLSVSLARPELKVSRKMNLRESHLPPQELLFVRLVTKSCPTLCDLMDRSPPGSSVHGLLQARTLEWVAVSSSTGSSRPRE